MHSRFLLLLIGVPALWAQGAQSLRPSIGVIDFYGVQKVSIEKLRKALGVKEGDPLPSSKGEVEAQLMDVPGVVGASIEATCCEAGKAILYVGIEERGAVHFSNHEEPDGTAALPPEVTDTYRKFLTEVGNAARAGLTAEDLTEGHSLMQDATVREIQTKFVGFATTYPKELHNVIRESSDEEARAIAAYVLGYAPDKNSVIDDLFYAMRDPDDVVRSNAIRALSAISVKAKLDPDAEIKIPATWFIEMLNSTVWTDRNYAATALVTLTESRDEKILAQLRERALPSLVEMAKWKHPEHAVPGYILLGRVAGISEQELQDAWKEGKRDEIIARATAKKKK
jgi:hypothetical protein